MDGRTKRLVVVALAATGRAVVARAEADADKGVLRDLAVPLDHAALATPRVVGRAPGPVYVSALSAVPATLLDLDASVLVHLDANLDMVNGKGRAGELAACSDAALESEGVGDAGALRTACTSAITGVCASSRTRHDIGERRGYNPTHVLSLSTNDYGY